MVTGSAGKWLTENAAHFSAGELTIRARSSSLPAFTLAGGGEWGLRPHRDYPGRFVGGLGMDLFGAD
jgi:hypothetical protein